ncbi:MAG: rhomboid family intramembrane serine protease, partial [Terriglobia bacterium]
VSVLFCFIKTRLKSTSNIRGIRAMLFPIGDDNRDRTMTPVVNYLLIVANVLVFVFLQGLGRNDAFTYSFSNVPQEIVSGRDVVTARRNVVDPLSGDRFTLPGLQPTTGERLGHRRYLTFYIVCGLIAALSHVVTTSFLKWQYAHSELGASGAISDVLGAHLIPSSFRIAESES